MIKFLGRSFGINRSVKLDGQKCQTGRSKKVELNGLKVLKSTVQKYYEPLVHIASQPFFFGPSTCIPYDRPVFIIGTVQFALCGSFTFFLFGPPTFNLLDRPLRSFWTFHFQPFGPSTFSSHDRLVSFF